MAERANGVLNYEFRCVSNCFFPASCTTMQIADGRVPFSLDPSRLGGGEMLPVVKFVYSNWWKQKEGKSIGDHLVFSWLYRWDFGSHPKSRMRKHDETCTSHSPQRWYAKMI